MVSLLRHVASRVSHHVSVRFAHTGCSTPFLPRYVSNRPCAKLTSSSGVTVCRFPASQRPARARRHCQHGSATARRQWLGVAMNVYAKLRPANHSNPRQPAQLPSATAATQTTPMAAAAATATSAAVAAGSSAGVAHCCVAVVFCRAPAPLPPWSPSAAAACECSVQQAARVSSGASPQPCPPSRHRRGDECAAA